jgi:Glycoside hydrolase family 44
MREAIAGFLASSLIFFFGQSTASAQSTVTIRVDAAANRRPINPNIYGVAHATTAQLNELNAPLHRNGGNNTTRHNWQLNADNRGNDWYYQSIPDNSATAGERGDSFITNSRAAGAGAMLTVPLIEWVAKVGPGRTKLASFSIAKYGPQTGNDWQWFPDAGNGIRTNGQFVTGNDPNDASVPSTAAFQRGWIEHLVNRWGTNANGGLRYYILDNEPSLWHATHRDVRPTGVTMDEIRGRMIEFGTMIKAVDPSALVAGPEEWGWSGYLFSGYDQQYGSINGWGFLPDRPTTAARTIFPGCSISSARMMRLRAAACWTSSPSTITRRAVSSAKTCRPRCSSARTARRGLCGIRRTSINPGSTIACS